MRKILLILTIFMLSISIKPVKALEKAADTLKKNIVTSGDGLYVDSTIDGRYIYRGGNPNNYIKLGDDLYRIISLEKDGTIKVIKQDSIGYMAWDTANTRYSTNDKDFCTSDWGCKSWGSNTTTLDINGNKVTQMPWGENGTLRNLPDKEASLNTYLNNYFYNNLNNDVKDFIVEGTWNVGPTDSYQTNLSESIKEESTYKWKGKVALMNATDYVKASTNNACTSIKAYSSSSSSCYNNSVAHNYLYSNNDQWTVSPSAISRADLVLSVNSGVVLFDTYRVKYHVKHGLGVRPTFYLSSETKLDGNGTKETPYTLITTGTNNDKKENSQNYNLPKLVDVITKKVITSGDGLYVDKYNGGRYVYKGGNPNNFIKFNNELWRIVSVEKDGTVKIIRANPLDNPTTKDGQSIIFNDTNSVNYGTYCSLSVYSNGRPGGCNAWGKSEYYVGGYASGSDSKDTFGTVTEDSFLNKYLNNEYYNKLSESSICEIAAKDYYFGAVVSNGDTADRVLSLEKSQIWNGNIALPSVSDVLLATTNEKTCGTLVDINSNYYSIINGERKEKDCTTDGQIGGPLTDECYNNCADTNWLMPSKTYKFTDYNYLLLNSEYNRIGEILAASYQGITGQAVGELYSSRYNNTFNIRPVTHLRNDIEVVSGDGSENNPYILESDTCRVKNESNQVVNVPSTSMFISIFIIGGFILIAVICIVIYLKVFKKEDINK